MTCQLRTTHLVGDVRYRFHAKGRGADSPQLRVGWRLRPPGVRKRRPAIAGGGVGGLGYRLHQAVFQDAITVTYRQGIKVR